MTGHNLIFCCSQEYEQLLAEAREAERKKEEFLSKQTSNFENMQLELGESMEKYTLQMEKKEHKINQAQRKLKEARVQVADYEKECAALQVI